LNIATLPILAAPMAGGPTTPDLVAAAATTGSLGFLAAGYLGASDLATDIASVRGRSTQFGVNLFVPDPQPVDRDAVRAYREAIAPEIVTLGAQLGPETWEDDDDWDRKVDLLVEDPVPWVSFTFGLPDATTVARLRSVDTRLLMTVTDAEEARAAADLAPDGLVVQASAAGGHRGTFDQRRPPGTESLPELVRAVTAATALPVVAAGGVGDRTDVREALQAGAEAVVVGTALLLADEAGTRPTHRRALADADSTTTTMRAYTGRVARGIRTGFSDRYDVLAPAAYPTVHHLTAPMRRWAAEHGDPDHLNLWAGTGLRGARSGPTAELLAALAP